MSNPTPRCSALALATVMAVCLLAGCGTSSHSESTPPASEHSSASNVVPPTPTPSPTVQKSAGIGGRRDFTNADGYTFTMQYTFQPATTVETSIANDRPGFQTLTLPLYQASIAITNTTPGRNYNPGSDIADAIVGGYWPASSAVCKHPSIFGPPGFGAPIFQTFPNFGLVCLIFGFKWYVMSDGTPVKDDRSIVLEAVSDADKEAAADELAKGPLFWALLIRSADSFGSNCQGDAGSLSTKWYLVEVANKDIPLSCTEKTD
jgi:hypothetical protein